MTSDEKRKGGGARTSRSETVTVRLDPRLRYLADLAARAQRRTLSSYIEWALDESLKTALLHREDKTVQSLADFNAEHTLWDPIESDRFCILANLLPNLLNHEEQLLWKLISEVLNALSTASDTEDLHKAGRLSISELQLVRRHWTRLQEAVLDELGPAQVVREIKQAEKAMKG